jgi:hypothetical protein
VTEGILQMIIIKRGMLDCGLNKYRCKFSNIKVARKKENSSLKWYRSKNNA